MAGKTVYVYAKCMDAQGSYLVEMRQGTVKECEDYVRRRAEIGAPVHHLFTSTLPLEAATKRYVK